MPPPSPDGDRRSPIPSCSRRLCAPPWHERHSALARRADLPRTSDLSRILTLLVDQCILSLSAFDAADPDSSETTLSTPPPRLPPSRPTAIRSHLRRRREPGPLRGPSCGPRRRRPTR